MAVKKRGLGTGLSALIGANTAQALSTGKTLAETDGELKQLPVEFLQPGRYQPRRVMTEDALNELAESIKAQGLIQPIVVRRIGDNKYEIIAGERRWRASQKAGLMQVPCLVKEVSEHGAAAMALIENIQREDLNCIEEAMGLQRLIHDFQLTQEQVATAVGKSRVSVTNLLRLLHQHADVKTLLERGDIEMGHARALLSLEPKQQVEAAREVAAKQLTVRDTEKLVRRLLQPAAEKTAKPQQGASDVARLERQLAELLGTPVRFE
ncbi:MAG TPA: ParB/RepB/Spo0J family partition protein, partial [Permianibacter sp.]|nr:ParB/RepB/Spo0J family partition protein [Permianibacter sp.]